MDGNGTNGTNGYAYSYLNPHPANRYANSAADRWPNGNYSATRGGWVHVLRCEGWKRQQQRQDTSSSVGNIRPCLA